MPEELKMTIDKALEKEPGERYHLGAGVVLEAGTYLAMVTFVGDRDDQQFWRRGFLVTVPERS